MSSTAGKVLDRVVLKDASLYENKMIIDPAYASGFELVGISKGPRDRFIFGVNDSDASKLERLFGRFLVDDGKKVFEYESIYIDQRLFAFDMPNMNRALRNLQERYGGLLQNGQDQLLGKQLELEAKVKRGELKDGTLDGVFSERERTLTTRIQEQRGVYIVHSSHLRSNLKNNLSNYLMFQPRI